MATLPRILQLVRDRKILPWSLAYLAAAWACLQGLQLHIQLNANAATTPSE